jgi:aspartyl-tRNA(Asn)/glutamyl-tRNA(Gln) amidotransferase subunit A
MPAFQASLADPTMPPDMSEFAALRESYREIFASVMDAHQLDALVFPQLRDPLPPLHGREPVHETTVSEINIAGLPGVVVPAGAHEGGSPFCLIFVGRPWSEADLLACAFDYEQATHHRTAPTLTP